MISSRDNPKLKTVRKLGSRRQREKLGLFAAEGEDLVAAALENGWEVEFALVDAARPPALELRGEPVASHLLAEVSTLGHAPRVIGVFRNREGCSIGQHAAADRNGEFTGAKKRLIDL